MKEEKSIEISEKQQIVFKRFLDIFLHEVKTPLNIMVGLSNIVKDIGTGLESHEYMNKIIKAGEEITHKIDSLANYDHLHCIANEMDYRGFNIEVLVKDIVNSFISTKEGRNISIELDLDSDIHKQIYSNVNDVKQLISILLDNAFKFTTVGKVSLSIRIIKDTDDEQAYEFKICDTGIGIEEKYHHLLFNRFYQVDGSMTRLHGGLGLGLYIADEIIQRLKGELQVESRLGEGSCFSFTFSAKKEFIEDRRFDTIKGLLKGCKILVIDDNIINRKLLGRMCKKWDSIVELAEDGEQALRMIFEKKATGESYDVAIIDYLMPNMNGIELGKLIKSDPQTKDMKLILLTAMGVRGDATRTVDAGFQAYLTKPVEPSVLYECIVYLNHEKKQDDNSLVTRYTLNEKRNKCYVLVIDENENILEQTKKKIEDLGFECYVANSLDEAIKAIDEYNFDLVFSDTKGSSYNGFDFTKIVRNREDNIKKIPIVALSKNEASFEEATIIGMNDFIVKPLTQEIIIECIRKWSSYSFYEDTQIKRPEK